MNLRQRLHQRFELFVNRYSAVAWAALTMLRWAVQNAARTLGLSSPPPRHYSLGDYDEEYKRQRVRDSFVVAIVVAAFVSLISVAVLVGGAS